MDLLLAVVVGVAVYLLVPGADLRPGAADQLWAARARVWGVDLGRAPVASAWGLGGAGVAAVLAVGLGGVAGLVAAGVVAAATALAPEVAFTELGRARRAASLRALPDFLRGWAASLDAGLPPVTGFALAAREVPGPLRVQLRRVVLQSQLRAGTLADRLGERAEALKLPALWEVATLVAASATGAPVAASIRRLAVELDQRHAHAERVAAAAAGPQKELQMLALLSVGMAVGLPTLLARMSPGGDAPPMGAVGWVVLVTTAGFPVVVLLRERARAEGG